MFRTFFLFLFYIHIWFATFYR